MTTRRRYDPDVKPGCIHLLFVSAACMIGWRWAR